MYLTFFVSENKLEINKVEYILQNYTDVGHLVIGPLISTVVLILLVPFASNGAYWISIKFDKWKLDKKNDVEKKKLLTIEQSLTLRQAIQDQAKNFDDLLENKNQEIVLLRKQVANLESQALNANSQNSNGNTRLDWDNEYEELKKVPGMIKVFDDIAKAIQRVSYMQEALSMAGIKPEHANNVINYYVGNDLIEQRGNQDIYQWTIKGKHFLKRHVNERFVSEK